MRIPAVARARNLICGTIARFPLVQLTGDDPRPASEAPWTLACYLIEGRPSRDYAKAKSFMFSQPDAWHRLMSILSEVVIAYLRARTRAPHHWEEIEARLRNQKGIPADLAPRSPVRRVAIASDHTNPNTDPRYLSLRSFATRLRSRTRNAIGGSGTCCGTSARSSTGWSGTSRCT